MTETEPHSIKKVILVVGLMGCGKTSVGKRVAKLLNLPFVDSDNEIEKAAGCTVAEIFNYYGEPAFRDGEKKIMLRLLDNQPCILAAGGGAFIPDEVRDKAKHKSITVWLKASLEVLEKRTHGRKRRPLLNNCNLKEKLENLIKQRYPIYETADIIVETLDEPVQKTAQRVISAIEEYIKEKTEKTENE